MRVVQRLQASPIRLQAGMAFWISLATAGILHLVSMLPGKPGLRLRPVMIFVVAEELGVTRANTCCAAL